MNKSTQKVNSKSKCLWEHNRMIFIDNSSLTSSTANVYSWMAQPNQKGHLPDHQINTYWVVYALNFKLHSHIVVAQKLLAQNTMRDAILFRRPTNDHQSRNELKTAIKFSNWRTKTSRPEAMTVHKSQTKTTLKLIPNRNPFWMQQKHWSISWGCWNRHWQQRWFAQSKNGKQTFGASHVAWIQTLEYILDFCWGCCCLGSSPFPFDFRLLPTDGRHFFSRFNSLSDFLPSSFFCPCQR